MDDTQGREVGQWERRPRVVRAAGITLKCYVSDNHVSWLQNAYGLVVMEINFHVGSFAAENPSAGRCEISSIMLKSSRTICRRLVDIRLK